jgi:hypothetical protein
MKTGWGFVASSPPGLLDKGAYWTRTKGVGGAPSTDSAAGQGQGGWGMHPLLTVQLDKDTGGGGCTLC